LKGIGFEICFAIPYYISVVFNLVETIVFLILRFMNMTCEHGMSTLLVILVLEDARVYIGTFDNGDMWTNVETSID